VILDQIVRRKREEIRQLAPPDPGTLAGSDRAFLPAEPEGRTLVRLIAEVKRASPSAGVLATDFEPVAIAREYEAGGASAISVLTDRDFFRGSIDDLRRVSGAVSAPVLRKDFIIDERQIHEARHAGAHSVLLIAAILERRTIQRFLAEARALGMEPLVEIHDEKERDAALEAGAAIIGINNRDLTDFRIDVGTTLRLAPSIPPPVRLVSESGVERPEAVARLAGHVDAVLVGTALMKSHDRRGLARELVRAGGGGAGGDGAGTGDGDETRSGRK
jgi:indole-3-glycerol phosphate synthase